MSQRIRYVGLEVSKETIAVAVPVPEADGSEVEYGDIANNPGAVRRLVETLSRDAVVKTAYEAGPTRIPAAPPAHSPGHGEPGGGAIADPAPSGGSGQDRSAGRFTGPV